MGRKRADMNADQVATMDRKTLTRAILSVQCDFPVDLTEDVLKNLNLEKLRHIYVALLAHAKDADTPPTDQPD